MNSFTTLITNPTNFFKKDLEGISMVRLLLLFAILIALSAISPLVLTSEYSFTLFRTILVRDVFPTVFAIGTLAILYPYVLDAIKDSKTKKTNKIETVKGVLAAYLPAQVLGSFSAIVAAFLSRVYLEDLNQRIDSIPENGAPTSDIIFDALSAGVGGFLLATLTIIGFVWTFVLLSKLVSLKTGADVGKSVLTVFGMYLISGIISFLLTTFVISPLF